MRRFVPAETVWVAVVWAFVLGYMVTMAMGCAGTSAARATLSTVAHVVDGIDLAESELYRERAAYCLDSSETAELYAECIRPHDRIVAAEGAVYHSLLAAEAALDAEEAGHGSSPLALIPCAANALDELVDALRALEINVPAPVLSAIQALRVVAPGRCSE